MINKKVPAALYLIVAVSGVLFFSTISTYCAVMFGVFAVLLWAADHIGEVRRRNTILSMCDEIDKILRKADSVDLKSYETGELSILASEIQKMTIRLREQNAAITGEKQVMKEAMEDISHQLRTPLTSMMLILEMLRDPDLSRYEQIKYIQELNELLTRMKWLIETLLNISRLDAGAVMFRTEKIDCRNLIKDALEPISVRLELKEIEATVTITGEPVIYGDLQYCTEALMNLLKNCMEHTPAGGRIEIAAKENMLYSSITIRDSGNGIAEKDLPHIFDRFYSSAERTKNGYGIGLAFAKKIITMHGGSLKAYNHINGGAVFEIRFYKKVV